MPRETGIEMTPPAVRKYPSDLGCLRRLGAMGMRISRGVGGCGRWLSRGSRSALGVVVGFCRLSRGIWVMWMVIVRGMRVLSIGGVTGRRLGGVRVFRVLW